MPCPGDKVVLTCITDTGSVVWEADNGAVTELTHLTQPTVRGSSISMFLLLMVI